MKIKQDYRIRKIVTVVLAVVMVIGTAGVVPKASEVQAAEAIEWQTVHPSILNDMTNFDRDVDLTWRLDYALDSEAGIKEQTDYATFTLQQQSVVRIRLSVENRAAYASNEAFALYGNASMGTPIDENTMEFGYGDDWLVLDAGTYYMKCKSSLYTDSKSNHTTKICIGAVPVSKAVEFVQTPSAKKDTVTVKIKQKLAAKTEKYKYQPGKADLSSDWEWGSEVKTIELASDPQFTVSSNGWYTIRFTVPSTVAFNKDLDFCAQVYVSSIDTKKPTISGVKNKKLYKKAVTIKFSDDKNGSGIASAKLNKKSVKTGKKITKDGVYTLVVTDKAGNKSSVTFTVDTTKPTTNIKKNRSYKVGTKITFKDKTSGVKKATLNGKKIKSGAKAVKKGSNTLKITDKAGNVTTVKFKVR